MGLHMRIEGLESPGGLDVTRLDKVVALAVGECVGIDGRAAFDVGGQMLSGYVAYAVAASFALAVEAEPIARRDLTEIKIFYFHATESLLVITLQRYKKIIDFASILPINSVK